MSADGTCRICEMNCHWTMHKNHPFVYVIKIRTVTKVADDLKRRYEEASGRKLTSEQIIDNLTRQLQEVRIEITQLTEETKNEEWKNKVYFS